MAQVAIRTEKLVHTYPRGNVMALKGVDLEIYVGDILSIVGQNGSGKTTLVRHFNGLLRPTSGKVYLMGEDTTGQTVAQMSRRCGYVFQNPNHQIFCTTVREELMVAPKNFGFSEQETQESLNRVCGLMDLEHLLDKHPMTLDYTTKKIVTIPVNLLDKGIACFIAWIILRKLPENMRSLSGGKKAASAEPEKQAEEAK